MTATLPSSSRDQQVAAAVGVMPARAEFADQSEAPVHTTSWAAPELVISSCESGSELRVVLPSDEQSLVVLGRDANCQIALDDPHVSRRHLKIVWTGGRHCVSDLGSRWGVTLNGELLSRPAALRHGDVLIAGSTLLRYVYYSSALRDMFAPPVVSGSVEMSASLPQSAEGPAAQQVQPEPTAQPAPQPPVAVPAADEGTQRKSRWYDKFVIATALIAVVLIAVAVLAPH